ncbi:hypothetical protein DBR24_15090 [Pseudomonas sp. HMWF006]|nr:hypothetical protein DBR24_15090 [Pseudomonas sp. HMWF006]PTT60931.1 hypothetical protein DBR26_28030 [Pseudomonas sp. HMWF007]PTT86136.1 hypothetical protein DBR29_22520 [Pseudomonas sp. HMWF005]
MDGHNNTSFLSGFAARTIGWHTDKSCCPQEFASKLAPTGECIPNVGASLLAKGPSLPPSI